MPYSLGSAGASLESIFNTIVVAMVKVLELIP